MWACPRLATLASDRPTPGFTERTLHEPQVRGSWLQLIPELQDPTLVFLWETRPQTATTMQVKCRKNHSFGPSSTNGPTTSPSPLLKMPGEAPSSKSSRSKTRSESTRSSDTDHPISSKLNIPRPMRRENSPQSGSNGAPQSQGQDAFCGIERLLRCASRNKAHRGRQCIWKTLAVCRLSDV